jgi:DNA repair exonuclease SbcCD ATPase subunit
MARGGITQTEVKKARDALIARGAHPSIDAVRIELGNTGSKTTIHRHLQALEAQEGRRLDDEALLSEGLRETVASVAHQLRAEARAVVETAETRHRAEREVLQGRIGELERERGQAVSEAEALRAELERTHGTLAETQQTLTQAQLRAQALETETAGLEQRLKERAEHVASLEQKHRQARDALEHYRQLAKEQRNQDQRNHEAQVQQLQAEGRRTNQLLVAKQDEVTRIASDNARLSAELAERTRGERDLQEAVKTDHQRIETLLADHARLQAEHASQEKALRAATTANAKLSDQLHQLQTTLAKRNARLHGLEGQLKAWAAFHPDGSKPSAEERATP